MKADKGLWVVTGVFTSKSAAYKYRQELKKKGFNARVRYVPKVPWHKTATPRFGSIAAHYEVLVLRSELPSMSAKAVAKQYWFGPIVAKRLATKGHTGWRKKDPAEKRRRTMIRAHDGDILAAARACQALANVTKDPETKRKAAADAKYLFRLYRRKKG